MLALQPEMFKRFLNLLCMTARLAWLGCRTTFCGFDFHMEQLFVRSKDCHLKVKLYPWVL